MNIANSYWIIDQGKRFLVAEYFNGDTLKYFTSWENICKLLCEPDQEPIFKIILKRRFEFPPIVAKKLTIKEWSTVNSVLPNIQCLHILEIDLFRMDNAEFIFDVLRLIEVGKLNCCDVTIFNAQHMESIIEALSIYDGYTYPDFILMSKVLITPKILVFSTNAAEISIAREFNE